MDPAFNKFSASSERGNLPLWPVSPSRENRLPNCPPLASVSPTRPSHERFEPSHTRGGSDVQNKVAAFNNLTKEAAQRRKDNEAALRRAILGREEAESETRRLKEENDVLRRDVEEGRGRERKVGERVESVMEDLQRAKETQAQAQAVYEKEVRRARKEAFKSSSALVKLQEELKTARNRYTLMRIDADERRQEASAKEEEALIAREALSAVRKELEMLKQQGSSKDGADLTSNAATQKELRELSEEMFTLQQKLSKADRKVEKVEMQKQVVEEERDALKQRMEEDQVATAAAQGDIALPPSRDGSRATFGEPESRTHTEDHPDRCVRLEEANGDDALSQLKNELHAEKRMRLEAEAQFHFSQMECQFGRCSCRIAEKRGKVFVHDGSLPDEMVKISTSGFSKGRSGVARANLPEKPRWGLQQVPGRSVTPKAPMPDRPRSQQAPGRQPTPRAHMPPRPASQQAPSRGATPRLPQHNRSVTETTFHTAKQLDQEARRSISNARNPSATPRPSQYSAQISEANEVTIAKAQDPETEDTMLRHASATPAPEISERLIDPSLIANRDITRADADNEEMLEIDFSSPYPQIPNIQNHPRDLTTEYIFQAPSSQKTAPPSPTMDFNFTEIIPNIPSIPRPLPTPPPPIINHDHPTHDRDHDHPATESLTTQIPLKDTPQLFSPAPNTPGGISREEALEQIRARRGRARSYAASHVAPTPKKGILGTPRREISAPAVRRA